MKPVLTRDVIGPIMVGPSSSHTAGALRIASMAKRLFQKEVREAEFILYGSFAHTFRGHGTDRALCAGLLGFAADDLRIRTSLELACSQGINVVFTPKPDAEYNHPNTVDVIMTSTDNEVMCVRGESIGGGSALLRRIDNIDVYITGEHNNLIVTQHDETGVLAHISSCISKLGINIASARMYRENRGKLAYTIIETDEALPEELKCAIAKHPAIKNARIIPADTIDDADELEAPDNSSFERFESLNFSTGAALQHYCEAHACKLSEAFLAREEAFAATLGKQSSILSYLTEALEVMREATLSPLDKVQPSMGGLIGGEARKLDLHRQSEASICDGQLSDLIRFTLAALETNASMGRIVAAPTAGSSGVIPAVLFSLQQSKGLSDEALVQGLLTAAAVGYLITRNATVSGAEGGCQAEIGAAAAMAAAAAVELAGGSPAQCFAAGANALSNLMGLVCDPIAGLVEVPCQKRNASAAATALVSAEIALAGVENLVSFDEVVEAMYKVGRALPFELRESALGGIAATPAACAWCADCRP